MKHFIKLCLMSALFLGCGTNDDVDMNLNDAKNQEQGYGPHQATDHAWVRSMIQEQGAYTPEPGDVRPFNDPLVQLGQAFF